MADTIAVGHIEVKTTEDTPSHDGSNSVEPAGAQEQGTPLDVTAEGGEDDVGDGDGVVSDRNFFADEDRFFAALKALLDTTDEVVAAAQVKAIKAILEQYQEQSMLLDPHLERAVTPLMEYVRNHFAARQPTAEDGNANLFPFQMQSSPVLHRVFEVVYLLCKTRGYKQIVKLFPHEVCDLEPTLQLLVSQDRSQHSIWHTRYVLLLWLSILVLIPFDLNTVDSSTLTASTDGPQSDDRTLIGSIIAVCMSYLSDPGAPRTGAAVCLSRLLTRPDMDSSRLRDFMQWASGVLYSSDDQSMFLTTGVFNTLVEIAKHGRRNVLQPVLGIVLPRVVELATTGTCTPLLRKLLMKLSQRIAMTFLAPRVVSWRYERGQRSLLDNLSGMSGTTSLPAGAGVTGTDEPQDAEELEPPAELQEIIEVLLTGLRDSDTVVRWSAAKGIGRITSRLPFDYADDVVGAVLALACPEESDAAWHGSCLALAELARRGLLLPSRLPTAVPVVLAALAYDVRRGLHSVGTHVRDAACYVCWAFARAYAPAVMRPHVTELARGMLACAVYDREINCRRAASAAFQENVGRQGHENFPNGIDILTAADYFSLGNRANAYLNVAPFIASFPTYRFALIDHLANIKLLHWDAHVRELSAKGLAKLTPHAPSYLANTILPKLLPLTLSEDLTIRHGAALGVAEVILALAQVPTYIAATTQSVVRNLIPKIEKARLYRGRGGELMRIAVCRLIECMALAELRIPHRLTLRLLDTIDEALAHPYDTVQAAAVAALAALGTYCLTPDHADLVDRVALKYAKLVNGDNLSLRRGVASALAVLPAPLLLLPNVMQAVLNALITGTQMETVVGRRDAETRRNCVTAVASIVARVGLAVRGTAGVSVADAHRVFAACVAASRDYATDKRGDVGSWVRQAAILAIKKLVIVFAEAQLGIVHSSPLAPGVVVSTEWGDATVDHVTADDAIVVLKFQAPAFGAWYFPYGSALFPKADVLRLLHKRNPSGAPTSDAASAPFTVSAAEEREAFLTAASTVSWSEPVDALTPRVCDDAVQVLLRVLGEKLDLLRGVAGETLVALLQHPTHPLQLLPEFSALQGIFCNTGVEAGLLNWSVPAQGFPLLVKALKVSEFCADVIEGLVTSVGGLSESVVKFSSAALLEWSKQQVAAKNWRTLQHVASALVSLITAPSDQLQPSGAAAGSAGAAAGSDAPSTPAPAPKKRGVQTRLVAPTLRTCALLLANGIFDVLQPSRSSFAADLLTVVRARIGAATDVGRILAGVEVLIALSTFGAPVGGGALQTSIEFLCHSFPSVRKATAEKLYVKLLTEEDKFLEMSTPDKPLQMDAALEVLTDTAWDGLELDALSAKRDALFSALQVLPPATPVVKSQGRAGDAAAADENASYAALVKEMHY